MAAEQWNYSLDDADDDPEKQHVFHAEEAYDEELNELYNSIPDETAGSAWYESCVRGSTLLYRDGFDQGIVRGTVDLPMFPFNIRCGPRRNYYTMPPLTPRLCASSSIF